MRRASETSENNRHTSHRAAALAIALAMSAACRATPTCNGNECAPLPCVGPSCTPEPQHNTQPQSAETPAPTPADIVRMTPPIIPRPPQCFCSGDGCGDDDTCGPPEGATQTVVAHVIDVAGQPVAGAKVSAGGAIATSDGAGNATLSNVSATYDLVVGLPASRIVYVMQGLTRADPTMQLITERLTPPRRGMVALRAKSFYAPVNFETVGPQGKMVFTALENGHFTAVLLDAGTPIAPYPFTLEADADAFTLTTRALAIYYGENDKPEGYQLTGGQDIAVSGFPDAVAQDSDTISMVGPKGPITVAGAVTLPAGATLSARDLGIDFQGHGGVIVAHETDALTADFSYVVPNPEMVPLRSYNVFEAENPSGDRLRLSTPARADPTLPDVAPTDLALNGTTFTWTPLPGALHIALIGSGDLDDTSAPLRVVCITAGARCGLPDAAALDPALAAPESWTTTWTVYALGGAGDINTAAEGAALATLFKRDDPIVSGEFLFGAAAPRAITVQR